MRFLAAYSREHVYIIASLVRFPTGDPAGERENVAGALHMVFHMRPWGPVRTGSAPNRTKVSPCRMQKGKTPANLKSFKALERV